MVRTGAFRTGIVQASGPRVDRTPDDQCVRRRRELRFVGASGQPTRAGSAQATLSAWVLWTSTPSPSVSTSGSAQRHS